MLELVDLFRSEFSNFFKDPFKKIKKLRPLLTRFLKKLTLKNA